MLQTTYTASSIHFALGTADRAIRSAAATVQGLAILAVIGTDTALNIWQDWSDRTFGTIQPHVLVAVEAIAYIIGWAAAMAWSYSRLACTNTWEAWLESAPQRALAAEVMGRNWDTAQRWFAVAYSTVTSATGYVLSSAPRWAGRAIAFALCVE